MATTTQARSALDPYDFLDVDGLLDDEERAIRDTVRQFVRERVLPEVGDWFEQGILPRELFGELARLGLLGMHLEGYGLPGASSVAYGIACRELEAGDAGVRSAVSVQGSLAMYAIWRWGTEEQKERWLPAMHAGEAIGCFGLTEPDAGLRSGLDANARAPRRLGLGAQRGEDVDHERHDRGRRGRLGEDGRRLDPRLPCRAGHEGVLRAGDPQEDLAARVRDERARARGRPRARGCGLPRRDDVARPALVPQRGALRDRLGQSSDRRGRASSPRSSTRASGSCSASPSSAFQLTQQKLAEMALEINRASLVALHLGRMKDAGTLRPEHVSLGKMGNVRGALEVCRSARTILGANGVTLEYPVIRHMNNLESVLTYEGTHEVHTLVVGQALTGENAFGRD